MEERKGPPLAPKKMKEAKGQGSKADIWGHLDIWGDRVAAEATPTTNLEHADFLDKIGFDDKCAQYSHNETVLRQRLFS